VKRQKQRPPPLRSSRRSPCRPSKTTAESGPDQPQPQADDVAVESNELPTQNTQRRRSKKCHCRRSAQLEFGIALAATSTIEVARLQWVAVKANSGRIIADLEPCALSGRRGAATHYQPVAGPLLSYTAAARLYEHIIAAHAICQPVTYTGAPARPIVDTGAGYHNAQDLFGSNMKLFLPSARATNFLLIIGFCSIGYALYLRYLVLEQSSVGLACAAGLNTWLCFTRRIADVLFSHSVFGWMALAISAVNLLRPSLVLFALALSIACFGVVLYNEGLSSIAVGLLLLSFARRAPEPN
jgi:hypothetical protein